MHTIEPLVVNVEERPDGIVVRIAGDAGLQGVDELQMRLNRLMAKRAPLVVLDLNMPRARGQEVLAFMAGNPVLRHMPVVVLTTSTRPGEIAECLRLGAVAVVTKPDSYDELIAQVERMLKYVEDWPGRS